jgi:DNA-binding NarL/FixJ family response regulator
MRTLGRPSGDPAGSRGTPKIASAKRILVADDHGVVRRGVRSLLEGHPRWKVCGEATDGKDAVTKARQLRPDVVIMDITMAPMNGLDATREILRVRPKTKVLILTMHESEQVVREVLSAGAQGYILKSDADRDLVRALETLEDGKPFFTSKVSQMVLDAYLHRRSSQEAQAGGRLTPRQREVVQLLATGKSNKEVAAALSISVKTAETHRNTIMHKLKFGSFSDLVRYAVRECIIEP